MKCHIRGRSCRSRFVSRRPSRNSQPKTEFVSFQSFVPCANNNAGEIVDISGYFVTRLYLHVVGTTFSGYFQFRPQNMTEREKAQEPFTMP